MKTLIKFCTPTLLMLAIVTQSLAGPAPVNLVAGAGPLGSVTNWAGVSAINLISGTSLFPVTTTQTVLYIGFTGGTTVDISNMALYTTTGLADGTIAAVTPVTLGGISNPSIHLTDTAVCPVQPVSLANPCVVRLDPIALAPSTLVDYYFVTYFQNDTNNATVASASSQFSNSTLVGWFELKDDTRLAVGQSVPTANFAQTNFLVGAMNN
jgi:hypothetical protein